MLSTFLAAVITAFVSCCFSASECLRSLSAFSRRCKNLMLMVEELISLNKH